LHILFIYPDVGDPQIGERTGGFQIGIGYISSVLKADGHQTSLLHITRNIDRDKLLYEIKKYKADLIACSSTTPQHPLVEKYTSWIKEEIDTPIICGGIHTTLCPDQVLSSKSIDMICVGEGEYPMLELVRNMEKGESIYDIQNLWIKKPDGTVKKNPMRPLISNLDALPFPDRELFNFQRLLRLSHSVAEFMGGRGCPYNCSYCCNSILKSVYNGKGPYLRIRSVENVLAEIRDVTEKYNVKIIEFHDDTFTLFPQWIEEFCEKYPKEFDLPFWCNARVETMNRQILTSLKKAGCQQLHIGVESGNEWLRQTVLKRNMTNQQIINAFKNAHELGIRTLSFNMVGIPFETPEMVEETIQLNKLIQPDVIFVSIFYPIPNTELWNMCEQNKYLTQNHVYSYFEDHTTLDLPTMSKQQITQLYHKFYNMALEKAMKTFHPTAYKYLKPFWRPKVLRTLKELRRIVKFRILAHFI